MQNFLETMNVIRVGRGRNWLGEVARENFAVETILQMTLQNQE